MSTPARARPADPPAFVALGPLRVARSSRAPLLAFLAGCFAAILLLGLWVLVLYRHRPSRG